MAFIFAMLAGCGVLTFAIEYIHQERTIYIDADFSIVYAVITLSIGVILVALAATIGEVIDVVNDEYQPIP